MFRAFGLIIFMLLFLASCSKAPEGASVLGGGGGLKASAPDISYKSAVGYVNTPLTITPTRFSSNGSTITSCRVLPTLPSGLTINTNEKINCQIWGTPQAVLQKTSFSVTVENGEGSATAILDLTILPEPTPPTLIYNPELVYVPINQSRIITPTLNSNGAAVTDCVAQESLPQGFSINKQNCKITVAPQNLASINELSIRAKNSKGWSPWTPITIEVTALAPTISYPQNQIGYVDEEYTLNPTLNTNGAPVTCTIDPALPEGLELDQNTCVISGILSDVYELEHTVTAENSAGSAEASFNIIIEQRPVVVPVLSYAVDTNTGRVGESLTISPTTLENGPITNCYVNTNPPELPLPAGLTINTGTCVISGTPSETLFEATEFSVIATNAFGNSTPASVIIMIGANTPFLSYENATGTSGVVNQAEPMSISPTTLNERGAEITNCAVKAETPLPTGLTIDNLTCEISGTPTQVSDITHQIRATNSEGDSAWASVSITITSSGSAPVLSYEGVDGSGYVGSSMQITPSTLTKNDQSVSCSSLDALPRGLTVDDECEISGTPLEEADATYEIQARNSFGTTTAFVSLFILNPTTLSFEKVQSSRQSEACLGPFALVHRNGPVENLSSALTINLSTTNNLNFFSDATCETNLVSNQVSISSNNFKSSYFYVNSEIGDTWVVDADPDVNDGSVAGTKVKVKIIPNTTKTWTVDTNPGVIARSRHSAVWTGSQMIVWGGRDRNGDPLNSGITYFPATDSWGPQVSLEDAPQARSGHTAVWTGTEMIIWGGENGGNYLNTGAFYDPYHYQWTGETPSDEAPTIRSHHSAVWNGTEMIVWGGYNGSNYLRNGMKLSKNLSDQWEWLSIPVAPSGSNRSQHTAVWADGKMLIFGGYNGTNYLKNGLSFNGTDWVGISDAPTGSERSGHSAIWNGSKMLIFGGYDGTNYLKNGFSYDLSQDSWTTLPDATFVRAFHSALWADEEMIVWGGNDADGPMNSGLRYHSSWSDITAPFSPSPRYAHSTIWTGTDMIMWGGFENNTLVKTNLVYTPLTDSWKSFSQSGDIPEPRAYHSAVFYNGRMIIWGGRDSSNNDLNDGGTYNISTGVWVELSSGLPNTPSVRSGHSAVWTGSKMVVWGGRNSGGLLDDGGLYTPGNPGSWEDLTFNEDPLNLEDDAPRARYGHSAVWSNDKMIIWGGMTQSGLSSDGKYLDYTSTPPVWSPMASNPNLSARYYHSAVVSGDHMIIWGGEERDSNQNPVFLKDGAYLDIPNNTWETTPTDISSLSQRASFSAVMTEFGMIIWGGRNDTTAFSDGYYYVP